MREILFRGKDIHGIWHIGLLAHIGNAWYISNEAGNATAYEVIPDTIGQFTGLFDKNGVRIFEGDIIQYDAKKYIVKFGEGSFGTVYIDSKTVVAFSDYANGVSYIDYEKGVETLYDVKVIGNLYDNLELLEVQ